MEEVTAAGKRIKGLPAGGTAADKDHVTKSEMKKSAKVRVCLFVCLSVCFQSDENRRCRGQNSREQQRPFNLPGNRKWHFKLIFLAEYYKKKNQPKNKTAALPEPFV